MPTYLTLARWLPIQANPSLSRSAVLGDYRDLTEEQEPQAAPRGTANT